jgi:hypothetical protein
LGFTFLQKKVWVAVLATTATTGWDCSPTISFIPKSEYCQQKMRNIENVAKKHRSWYLNIGISSGFFPMARLKHFWQDERGAASFMFIAASSVFLGVAGLGMEVGTWYVEHRHGQSVADAAAIAGVMSLGTPATNGSAVEVATANGYTAANVTVYNPPPSGPQNGNSNAVMVRISRDLPRSFTAMLMGSGSTNVSELATAVRASTGNACSLALGGGLSFSGSAQVTAPNCVLASNRSGSDSISFSGAGANKNMADAILVGNGGCTENGSGTPCEQSGNLMYQPKATDPYSAVQSDPIPSAANSTNCKASATISAPFLISGGTNPVYCIGKDITGGTFTADNATYYLYDASIKMTSGSLTCTHCTIIFTGSAANKMGSLSINGGTVTMTAIKTNSNNAHLDGLLFYMDARFAEHTNACGSAPVSIQGSSTISLNGALYFPNASVCMTGNAFAASETCMALTGWSVAYQGNLTEIVSGCSALGTQVSQVEAIALVQ